MPYDYQSSLPAYQENKQGKDKCKAKVLDAIKKLQPVCDRQLSAYTGLAINVINGRRHELVNEDHVVVLAMKAPDPETKRTVSFWKVKEVNYQPVLF